MLEVAVKLVVQRNKKRAYVEEEGPRRGFSLKGWKERRPKKVAMQETEFLGQLLTYMVMKNMIVLAITKAGIIQGTHFLKCLTSW